jgi:PhnB protein
VDAVVADAVGGNAALERLSGFVEWCQFEKLMKHLRHNGPGQAGYPVLVLFRALLLQSLYGLSDREVEGAMSKVDPVPRNHSPLEPQLIAKNAVNAIDFYRRAFGATEDFRLVEPSGKIGHAEIRIEGALIALADEYPDFGCLSPATIGGNPVRLQLYMPDVDASVTRAVEAGATMVRALRNEFYGDRTATVADPFGYQWQLSTRIETVSPEEMQSRWDRMMPS